MYSFSHHIFFHRLFYKTTTMELPIPCIIMNPLCTQSSVSKNPLTPIHPVLSLFHILSEGALKPSIPAILLSALRQGEQTNQMVLIPQLQNGKGQSVVIAMDLVPTSLLPIRLDLGGRDQTRPLKVTTICQPLHWCPRALLGFPMRVI
jgi:hypothetical protein